MEPYRIHDADQPTLSLLAGSAKVLPHGLAFQSHDGIKAVPCTISRDAFLDLCGYHGVQGADDDAFKAIEPQLERLARKKYRAGRVERSGELAIMPADLLLYGFESRY